ncbi:peptidoglycan D,D-transpeptidase FtsI family protein [Nocardiopsis coralliicola]
MNTPIRRLAMFAMALFGVLLLNVTYIQAFAADNLRTHEFNGRQFTDRLTQPRGPILAGSEEIAFSEPLGKEGEEDDDTYQRDYPAGGLYSHVVGTFPPRGQGIELQMNSLLDGSDERLAVRNFIDTLTGDQQQGASVELTLDPEAQQAAADGFESLGKNGAAVALDPETGAILASYSNPGFNPNDVSSASDPEASDEAWRQLEEDGNKPLLNRAISERYAPGSTFKLVTAAAALEGGATPESTMDAPATLDLGAPLPNAWDGPCNGGQPDTLAHSIEQSCNTSFANWAIDVGPEAMAEQADAFGFNQGDLSTPMPALESLYPTEDDRNLLGRSGIGQANVEATPLQMAMVAAGIANSGDVMKPYYVESVKDSDLSEIEGHTPEKLSTAVSAKTAEDLTQMMILVTEGEDASGPGGAIQGMQVAGKTGTAETESGPTHNWFVSFAPADDPQVAVAVVVEHGGGSGGTLAAPISKGIMEAVIDQ